MRSPACPPTSRSSPSVPTMSGAVATAIAGTARTAATRPASADLRWIEERAAIPRQSDPNRPAVRCPGVHGSWPDVHRLPGPETTQWRGTIDAMPGSGGRTAVAFATVLILSTGGVAATAAEPDPPAVPATVGAAGLGDPGAWRRQRTGRAVRAPRRTSGRAGPRPLVPSLATQHAAAPGEQAQRVPGDHAGQPAGHGAEPARRSGRLALADSDQRRPQRDVVTGRGDDIGHRRQPSVALGLGDLVPGQCRRQSAAVDVGEQP